jgi:hypothetical protein
MELLTIIEDHEKAIKMLKKTQMGNIQPPS